MLPSEGTPPPHFHQPVTPSNSCCITPPPSPTSCCKASPTAAKVPLPAPQPQASCCASTPSSCCAIPTSSSKRLMLLKAISIIGRIALTIFAAFIMPMLTLISFAAGTLIGGTYAAIVKCRKGSQAPLGNSKPVCAQGYVERLSGIQWPTEVTQITTDAFIATHVYHLPFFFVPFVGGLVGFWAGMQAFRHTCQLANKIFHRTTPTLGTAAHAG